MECALAESIFCCPRTRFFREERFPAEAVCTLLFAPMGAADGFAAVLGCLRVVAVAAGFVAGASSLEAGLAFAAMAYEHMPKAHAVINRALRICVQTLI